MKNSLGQHINKYGRWTVIRRLKSKQWLIKCECGTIKIVKNLCRLKRGDSKSCGCILSDLLVERNYKHGSSKTLEYGIWKAIYQRCHNTEYKRYADYGGRGIKVCKRWRDPENGFQNFLDDMGKRPKNTTIGRIDNNEDYTPDNCCWMTMKEQNRNKRNSLMITYKNKTQCLTSWAEELGFAQSCLYYRIVTAKWPIEEAMEKPSKSRL